MVTNPFPRDEENSIGDVLSLAGVLYQDICRVLFEKGYTRFSIHILPIFSLYASSLLPPALPTPPLMRGRLLNILQASYKGSIAPG
jgi:hypothetical protein